MSIFKRRKKDCDTPEFKAMVIPPMPKCEPPKKKFPEPPFDATIAASFSESEFDKKVDIIKNYIWKQISNSIKKGKISCNININNEYWSPYDNEDEIKIKDAARLIGKKLASVMQDISIDFVKYGYTVVLTNKTYPKTCHYYETNENGEKVEKTAPMGDSYYLTDTKFDIELWWRTDCINENSKFTYIDQSVPAIRHGDSKENYTYRIMSKTKIYTYNEIINGAIKEEI